MIGHSNQTLEEKPYIPTMIYNRLIPTVGIALLAALSLRAGAQGPAPAPAETTNPASPSAPAGPSEAPPTEAEQTLAEAARKVAAIPTVAADIEQSVDMLNQKFAIKGRYLKATGGRLLLELAVAGLPGSSGEMRQVCDGSTLWDYKQLLESKYYSKINLNPIIEKLKSPEIDAAARQQILTRLGVAGPDVLLVSLGKAILFDQKEEGTLDGRPVWILRGTWKDRQGLLGPNQQPLPPNGPLPPYVPSQATLYIGKEDGWPYKLRLAGRQPTMLFDTRRVGVDGQRIGSRSTIQTIEPSFTELVYKNIDFHPTFKDDAFVYNIPAGVRPDDGTETLLGELEQLIQMKIAQKKAEAAKAEPILDQAIPVPRSAESSPGPANSPPSPSPPLSAPKSK